MCYTYFESSLIMADSSFEYKEKIMLMNLRILKWQYFINMVYAHMVQKKKTQKKKNPTPKKPSAQNNSEK